MNCNSICIMGILEWEMSEQGIENLFEEIMTENFLSLVKEQDIQIQEAQSIPNNVAQTGLHQDLSYLKWQSLKTRRES